MSLGQTNPKRCIEHLEVKKNSGLESEVEKLRKELKETKDSASRNAPLINKLTTYSNQLESNLISMNMELAETKDEL